MNSTPPAASGSAARREAWPGPKSSTTTAPGDSPSWTSPGSTWSRDITGIGGELAAVQESSGTVTFKLTDLHGDVVASAGSSPTETKPLATYRFDEFGEPEGTGSAGRFGWLGGHYERTDLSSGVIQMGARSYIPSLGRFLTPDPVPGGSANAYDYADRDPVNVFDLSGECVYGKTHPHCISTQSPKQLGEETRKANRARAISVYFTSRAAAQQVVHTLQTGSHFTEKLLGNIGHWKESEVQAMHAKAAKAAEVARWAGPPPTPKQSSESGNTCSKLAFGTGLASTAAGTIAIDFAPETGGVSVALGVLSGAIGAAC